MSVFPNPLPSVWKHRGLIFDMAKRDVLGRYRGSLFGLLWSLFNPLFMLTIYTFAFGVLFKSRWPGNPASKFEFAIILFSSLLTFNFFTECINRAPGLIIDNANYVKKVVFPLEVFAPIALLSALFHLCVGLGVWTVGFLLVEGHLAPTLLLLPVLVIPLLLFTLGCSWMLAALGVYFRDIRQIMAVFTSGLIFLAPVFYPLSAVPRLLQSYIWWNPMTHFVELQRNAMVYGVLPDAGYFLVLTLLCMLSALLGYGGFQLTRKGFADVL